VAHLEALFSYVAFSVYLVCSPTELNYKLNYKSKKSNKINELGGFLVRSGRRDRRFESSHPDHKTQQISYLPYRLLD
jgi:hypothetical protein